MTRHRGWAGLALVAPLTWTAGCAEGVSSASFDTGELTLIAEAISAEEGNTHVRVELRGPQGELVVIEPEEPVVASLQGEGLDESHFLAEPVAGLYETFLPTSDDAPTIAIAWARPGRTPALHTEGRLPPGAELLPPIGASVSRKDILKIAWIPEKVPEGDFDVEITVEGGCFFTKTITGRLYDPPATIDAAGLLEQPGVENASCDALVTLDVLRDGAVDPAFATESTFSLRQRRTIGFVSSP